METARKSKREKISVPPPAGYHWMEESGRYYLMEGEYEPHEGALEVAEFKLVNKH
tara:strand:- start:9494 stop:9658 length:165 start_codon:yes stop_codon:yes gene_type:complete